MCSKAQKSEHEGDWYGKGLNFNWAAKFTNLDKWYGVKYNRGRIFCIYNLINRNIFIAKKEWINHVSYLLIN